MLGNRQGPIPAYTAGKRQRIGISLGGKRLGLAWWILVPIFGLALFLFTSMPTVSSVVEDTSSASSTPPNLTEEAPTIGVWKEQQPQDGGETSNAEALLVPDYASTYDNPFLNDEAGTLFSWGADERSAWVVGGGLVIKLALVIVLIYVVLAGLRWLQGGRRQKMTGGATIRVLETVGIAPGRALHLVVVGEKTLLIGATDHQLSLLAELQDAVAPLRDEVNDCPPEWFDEALRSQEARTPASPPETQGEALPDMTQLRSAGDWRVALDGLRASVRRMRESAGE
jgi:flagellar biosynthetic protein FliO